MSDKRIADNYSHYNLKKQILPLLPPCNHPAPHPEDYPTTTLNLSKYPLLGSLPHEQISPPGIFDVVPPAHFTEALPNIPPRHLKPSTHRKTCKLHCAQTPPRAKKVCPPNEPRTTCPRKNGTIIRQESSDDRPGMSHIRAVFG